MSAAKTINFDELKKAVTPEITRRILQHFKVEERFTAEPDGSLRGSCPFRSRCRARRVSDCPTCDTVKT